MSRVPEQGKHPDEERWICSKDPKHVAMTSALKAIKLPEGSPAVRYGFDHPHSPCLPAAARAAAATPPPKTPQKNPLGT